jgi:hypothetical protein
MSPRRSRTCLAKNILSRRESCTIFPFSCSPVNLNRKINLKMYIYVGYPGIPSYCLKFHQCRRLRSFFRVQTKHFRLSCHYAVTNKISVADSLSFLDDSMSSKIYSLHFSNFMNGVEERHILVYVEINAAQDLNITKI